MPKKQKQSKQIPGEERAPGFSLGDFMTVAAPRGHKNSLSTVNSDDTDSFPALGQISQTLPAVSAGTCWASKPAAGLESEAVDSQDSSGHEKDTKVEKAAGLPYTIGKTKKGSLPIRVENRNKGKKVTVVFNVSGNLKELLSELKHAAGSGGVVKDDTVEIQGDKAEFVEKFLKNKLKKK